MINAVRIWSSTKEFNFELEILECIRNIIGVRPRCFHVAIALVSGNLCSLMVHV